MLPPPLHVVVMGVAGCGKSVVGAELARRLALPLIEGDDFHPERSIHKVRAGAPLTDEDRSAWVARLAEQLRGHHAGAVLACAALQRSDRDGLRAAAPALHFLHLALTPHQALERAAARTDHFYPPSLVASEFDLLEDPCGEPRVRAFDATQHVDRVVDDAAAWLLRAPFNNA